MTRILLIALEEQRLRVQRKPDRHLEFYVKTLLNIQVCKTACYYNHTYSTRPPRQSWSLNSLSQGQERAEVTPFFFVVIVTFFQQLIQCCFIPFFSLSKYLYFPCMKLFIISYLYIVLLVYQILAPLRKELCFVYPGSAQDFYHHTLIKYRFDFIYCFYFLFLVFIYLPISPLVQFKYIFKNAMASSIFLMQRDYLTFFFFVKAFNW